MAKSRDRQAEDELTYHRREWRFQRAGWAVMALIVVAALAGLFGSGPLSDVTRGDSDRGTVQYERFARYGAEATLRICAPPSTSDPSRLQVRIPRDYLETFEIRSVVPEASSMQGRPEAVEFAFDLSTRSSCVLFHLDPRRIGVVEGSIRLGTGQDIAVSQFVYP